MELDDIRQLVTEFRDSDLATFELDLDDAHLSLSKPCAHPAPVVAESQFSAQVPVVSAPSATAGPAAPSLSPASGTPVTAPLVGVFYAASSPDAEPFVSEGSQVSKGQVVCIVEAMKAMNEIKAPCSGTVASISAKDGELVSFGQTIMEIAG